MTKHVRMRRFVEGTLYQHRYRAPFGGNRSCTLLVVGQRSTWDRLLALATQIAPGSGALLTSAPSAGAGDEAHLARGRRLTAAAERQAAELADLLTLAAERYGFDEDRVMALGVHEGAGVAAALLLLRRWAVRGAILLRPPLPLVPQNPPFLAQKAVLLAADARDPSIPPRDAAQLAAIYRAAGADVQLTWTHGDPSCDTATLRYVGVWAQHTIAHWDIEL